MSKTFSYAHTLLVPYAAQQVYAVVDDVANYHRFLPNCSGSGIVNRTTNEGTDRVLGFMNLSLLGLQYRLESDNRHTPCSRIEMNLLKGPFKTLTGQWEIHAFAADGCKVSFAMQWQYDNALLAMTVGQRFEGIAKQLLDAFIAETARRAA